MSDEPNLPPTPEEWAELMAENAKLRRDATETTKRSNWAHPRELSDSEARAIVNDSTTGFDAFVAMVHLGYDEARERWEPLVEGLYKENTKLKTEVERLQYNISQLENYDEERYIHCIAKLRRVADAARGMVTLDAMEPQDKWDSIYAELKAALEALKG